MAKIGNNVVSVEKGIEMNEKDYCVCLLSILKDMEKNYTISMTEASNEWLYDIYMKTYINISNLQRRLYELMFKKGWYQLESVDKSKLDKKYSILNTEYKDLSD